MVETTRVRSMDMKDLMIPKSDCEVVLLGDCAKQNHEILVSLKQTLNPRSNVVEKKVTVLVDILLRTHLIIYP